MHSFGNESAALHDLATNEAAESVHLSDSPRDEERSRCTTHSSEEPMLRQLLLVAPVLLVSCATPSSSPSIATATSSPRIEVRSVEPTADAAVSTEGLIQSAPPYQTSPPMQPRRLRQRFNLKGGYLSADEDGFDDGFIVNGSWMRPISDVLSSEVEIGYLDASGSDNFVDRDVWAIPFMANARVNVPLGEKLEIYGGLGLGSFYYNADADTSGVSVSGDGFLFAGDAFFGGDILLGENFRLGLEGKYYATDNSSDLGGGLDSFVVLLTLGFDR
jgi:hypothetical protein